MGLLWHWDGVVLAVQNPRTIHVPGPSQCRHQGHCDLDVPTSKPSFQFFSQGLISLLVGEPEARESLVLQSPEVVRGSRKPLVPCIS